MSTSCSLQSVPAEVVEDWLKRGSRLDGNQLLLVDIRGHVTFQKSHLKSAINLRFSTLLLRRIFRGTSSIESVCSETARGEIERRRQSSVLVVLYDESSTSDNTHKDIHLYAEMLRSTSANDIMFIDGGFDKLANVCNYLCEGANVQKFPRKKPSLSFPLGEHKHYRSNCSTLSYQEELLACPPSEVFPYLYIGSAENSSDQVLLQKLGVTAILNVSHNSPKHFEKDFEYKNISVLDDHHADLLSELSAAIEFIDVVKQQGGCTLVHCVAGISRSATVCIAYLMKHLCWELQRAFDFLKTKRSCVAPNLSFMGQLLVFQKQLNIRSSPGLFLQFKEEARASVSQLKRSSPTTEEARLVPPKAAKPDSSIVSQTACSNNHCGSPELRNKFARTFKMSSLDARKKAMLLPLKASNNKLSNSV